MTLKGADYSLRAEKEDVGLSLTLVPQSLIIGLWLGLTPKSLSLLVIFLEDLNSD